MRKKLITLAVAAMAATVTFAKDIKTLVVTTTPQMHCEGCEKKIKNEIRFVKGVKNIVTSVENQTVSIKYDADKTSQETIIKAFSKIGYNTKVLKEGEKVKKEEGAESCDNM